MSGAPVYLIHSTSRNQSASSAQGAQILVGWFLVEEMLKQNIRFVSSTLKEITGFRVSPNTLLLMIERLSG
jgi:hypothetical protein